MCDRLSAIGRSPLKKVPPGSRQPRSGHCRQWGSSPDISSTTAMKKWANSPTTDHECPATAENCTIIKCAHLNNRVPSPLTPSLSPKPFRRGRLALRFPLPPVAVNPQRKPPTPHAQAAQINFKLMTYGRDAKIIQGSTEIWHGTILQYVQCFTS